MPHGTIENNHGVTTLFSGNLRRVLRAFLCNKLISKYLLQATSFRRLC